MTDSTTDNRTTELLPCPFCGGEAETIDEFDEYREKWGGEFDDSGLAWGASYKAVCCPVDKGGCGAIGGWQPTEAEAIAAWNTRAVERTVYIVETYDEILDGPYVEPTCYASKQDAIRRVESQNYMDEDGVRHWAHFKELRVVSE